MDASSSTELFAQGVEWAGMATQMDQMGDYEQARELYFKAADILYKISAVELNENRKATFRDKATCYVSRCEQLNALLGVVAPTSTGQVKSQWQKQETFGDKAYKQALILHEERQVHEAVKEYQRAMGLYVKASRDADIASQHRIRDKWTQCGTTAQKISSIIGVVFSAGPSTVLRTKGEEELAEPPTGAPGAKDDDDDDEGGDNDNDASGGGGGDGDTGFDASDNSFSALEARLRNLKQ